MDKHQSKGNNTMFSDNGKIQQQTVKGRDSSEKVQQHMEDDMSGKHLRRQELFLGHIKSNSAL